MQDEANKPYRPITKLIKFVWVPDLKFRVLKSIADRLSEKLMHA